MAHRGTLFLDEVGDIPLDLQPKLLRALQEKAFERLGGTKTIPIDVRLVAATNRNLTQMMGDKLFRSDLYYRLKVFPVNTPPLRDHPEDIPVLARHFTKKYSEKMGRQIDKIPSETMRALVAWRWPGNVRELENFIERSVILSTGSSLRAPWRKSGRRCARCAERRHPGTGGARAHHPYAAGERRRGHHRGHAAGTAPHHAERDDAQARHLPQRFLTAGEPPDCGRASAFHAFPPVQSSR